MNKERRTNSGFTLAELLIVVAIISVLVAIGIPVFTTQLEKSRESVDLSNVRAAYAEVMMAAITTDTTAVYTQDTTQTIYKDSGEYSITVSPLKQRQDGWQTALPITIGGVSSGSGSPYWTGVPAANGYCKVTYHAPKGLSDGYLSYEWSGEGSSGPTQTITPTPTIPSGSGESGGTPTPTPDATLTPTPPPPWTDFDIKKYPTTGSENLFKGNVYRDEATQKLYVIKKDEPNADVNWIAPSKPNNEYVFVAISGTVYTENDEYDKTEHKIENIKEGDIYKTADGKYYISTVNATHQTTPSAGEFNEVNWVLITPHNTTNG